MLDGAAFFRQRTIRINRGPVLTLWAAVVAERLGFGHDMALTLGRASLDTNFSIADKAAHVCPVGAIFIKRVGFATPIGERRYDLEPISEEATRCAVEEAK